MQKYEFIFELIIVITAMFGLLRHSGILKGKFRRNMFLYYTNLSNLVVLIYFLLRVLLSLSKIKTGLFYQMIFWEALRFIIMMCITVTFLIYHFLLAPHAKETDRVNGELKKHKSLNNIIVHYVVPCLALWDWILFADKSGLNSRIGLIWTMLPLTYVLFAFIRAHFHVRTEAMGSPYPYTFIDPMEKGWKQVGLNVVVIWAVFVVLGFVLIGLGRWIS